MSMKLTARERMVLAEIAGAHSLYRWAPQTCKALASKGLVSFAHNETMSGKRISGYRITDAGRAALASATGGTQ